MKPSSRARIALAAILLGTALSAGASAEPIRVLSGGVGFDTGDPAGLGLEGDGFVLRGIFLAIDTAPHSLCAPCAPGAPIDLSGVFGGARVGFRLGQATQATIDGTTYVPPVFPVTELRGTFTFAAPTALVPDNMARVVLLTGPFTFTGSVAGFKEGTLFELDLTGQGTALLGLERRDDGLYGFRGMSYTFDALDPVPEPATLVLFGLGAAVLYGRRRAGGPRQ